MRFDQCGTVARDCNSALLDAIQEKKTQRFRANAAEPEAAEQRLDELWNASDNSDVDVCASSAVRYSSEAQSRHVYLYST